MKDIAKEKNKDKECEESKAESLKYVLINKIIIIF
jgi:hypothetical protein